MATRTAETTGAVSADGSPVTRCRGRQRERALRDLLERYGD
ncbi:MAG: hypothetical protein ABEJ42_08395 [Halobacteriaceae archaeon]